MARQRFKKGLLEYSTNTLRNIMAKRLLVEVRCRGFNNPSHAYCILGIKHKEERC